MLTIVIEENNHDEIKSFLKNGIREFNYQHLDHYELKPFSIVMRDDQKNRVAGIGGFVLKKHKTIRSEFVWVQESLRRQGIGTQLLNALEQYAKQQDCNILQLSTMDFQSPAFYEKQGYQCIGIIPKWFCDHDEIFFSKEIL